MACGPAGTQAALLAHLGRSLGLSGEALFLSPDPHGRPRATAGGTSLAVSVSHCRETCSVALAARGRVGVDLVDPRSAISAEDLMELAAPAERAWLLAVPVIHRQRRLLQVWAAREALLKALGMGLALGAEAVELAPLGAEGLRPVKVPGCPDPGGMWHLELAESGPPGPPLILALAWAD